MVRPGTPVRLAGPVHTELQRAALQLSAKLGRRLSMSDVVQAALTVARRHEVELLTELTPVGGESS